MLTQGDRIVDIREAWDDSLHSVPAPSESVNQATESNVSSDEETLLDLLENLPVGAEESVSSNRRVHNSFPAFKKGFLVQNGPTAGLNDSCGIKVEEKGATTSKPCLKKNKPQDKSRPISKFKQRMMRQE